MSNQPTPAKSGRMRSRTDIAGKFDDDPRDPKWKAKPAAASANNIGSHHHALTENGYKQMHDTPTHAVYHNEHSGAWAVLNKRHGHTHVHEQHGTTKHAHHWDLESHLEREED